MEEQLKQDIKAWGLALDCEPPTLYPLNVCDNVARELGIQHTVVKHVYGEK